MLFRSIQKVVQSAQKKLQGFQEHRYFTSPFTLLEKKLLMLDFLKERLEKASPKKMISYQVERFHRLEKDLHESYRRYLSNQEMYFKHQVLNLEALSPLKVLSQGYSMVYQNDSVIASVNQLDAKTIATVKMRDGSFEAMIQSIRKEANDETKS